MPRSPVALAGAGMIVMAVSVVSACSSSSKAASTSKASSTSSSAAPTTVASASSSSAPAATSAPDPASAPAPAPASPSRSAAGGSANVLDVAGSFTAHASQGTQSMCTTQTIGTGTVGQYTLFYNTGGASGPSNVYEVDFQYVPVGAVARIPVANPPVTGDITVRFSYNSNNGYLDWVYSAAPPVKETMAAGEVKTDAGGKSGSFNVTLPFSGNDGLTIAAGAMPNVKLVGSFACK